MALLPGQQAVEHLDAFLEPRRAAAGFRWTLPEHLHVTLAFLPEVPERSLDALVEGLGVTVGRKPGFEVRLAGGVAFPHPAGAKVVAAGLALDDAGASTLAALARDCRGAAAHAGVAVDGARFRPHVTVARTGRPTEVTSWVRLLDAYDGPAWRADEVHLVESHLGEGPRRRPRYEVVAGWSLGPGS